MDSITQAALGAAVGEAVAGKRAGNKAILWGAVAGTIPDLDVIPGNLFMNTVDQLSFHRGISHSIVFALLISPLLGYFAYQLHKKKEPVGWLRWSMLFFWGIFTHALLDCFTTWGTQLLWPLPNRIAIKSIFVIDPLYTLPLLICLVILMFKSRQSRTRRFLNVAGLSVSSLYLIFTLYNKQKANDAFEKEFARQQLSILRYESRPAPLNNILWTVNAESESGFYIGYYSLMNNVPNTELTYIPKDHHLLNGYSTYDDVQQLINITNGWYALDTAQSRILLHDLRFGVFNTWQMDSEVPPEFVFTYLIEKCKENKAQEICIKNKDQEFDWQEGYLKKYMQQVLGLDQSEF